MLGKEKMVKFLEEAKVELVDNVRKEERQKTAKSIFDDLESQINKINESSNNIELIEFLIEMVEMLKKKYLEGTIGKQGQSVDSAVPPTDKSYGGDGSG